MRASNDGHHREYALGLVAQRKNLLQAATNNGRKNYVHSVGRRPICQQRNCRVKTKEEHRERAANALHFGQPYIYCTITKVFPSFGGTEDVAHESQAMDVFSLI